MIVRRKIIAENTVGESRVVTVWYQPTQAAPIYRTEIDGGPMGGARWKTTNKVAALRRHGRAIDLLNELAER